MAATEERLTVSFSDMAQQGDAFARHNDTPVFAAYGIPGEEAVVQVKRGRRRYLTGQVVELIKASPHRVEPRCQHYGRCTGCQWQHIDYPFQLDLKRRAVERQMGQRGDFLQPPVLATLPAIEPWHYRNHARFSVDPQGQLGFVHRQSGEFVAIDYCHLMHPWINSALSQLQGKCPGAHQVAARYGVGTGSWLIQPKLTSPEIALESGQPFYEEELLGRRFRISASSFFQVSTLQAERLVEVVQDRLDPTGGELVIDVYAGVGTFAVLLGPQVRRVVAIEEASSAVKDATENIVRSGNIEFRQGKAEEVLPQLGGEVDVAILDPPRLGCHPRAITALLQRSPRKIIYVSCEPATLARDLRALCQGGYRLVEVQPVDMFPQTYHVECVATLVREDEFSPKLVLASTSPRRRELLFALGLDFEAISPHQDESPPIAGEAPEATAQRLAWAKAMEVSATAPSSTVVAADTLVIHRGKVLGKPGDAQEAQQMLCRLRGEEHLVITGVAVISAGRSAKGHTTTKVVMRSYSDDELAAYIASGEAFDKAGAYGIQDPLFAPAFHVEGCYQNVVGLPLCCLARLLNEVGFERRSRPLWALPSQCQECPLRDTLTAGSLA